jgi:hypothetical protein
MTDPNEIIAHLYDRNSGLADRIGRDVGSFSVALLSVTGSNEDEELRCCGSGSLVTVGDSYYVLTAAHVWEKVANAAGIGLTLDEEEVDHRFVMSVKSIVPYGPKLIRDWMKPWAPDMHLLKIPAERVAELKARKRFYPLTADISKFPNVNALEKWMLMGAPDEQGDKNYKHRSVTMNGIFATVQGHPTIDGYDYVDLDMDVTFPGIPNSFSGISGGGYWSVFMYGSADGEIQWILTLVGMACWEHPLVLNGIRSVRCFGDKSIRSPKRWLSFLRNHREAIAAMDFFTVPTITFRVLYCFFIISHDRRRILHFNVTQHPTSTWIVQQLREVFPYQLAPKFLIFDRDAKFGAEVPNAVRSMAMNPVRRSFQSPWQNGIAERWVGSCRRDLLDHAIAVNEHHLRRLLSEYVCYHREDRTHLGLDKETPNGRARSVAHGRVIGRPRLGGLHHRYDRAA